MSANIATKGSQQCISVFSCVWFQLLSQTLQQIQKAFYALVMLILPVLFGMTVDIIVEQLITCPKILVCDIIVIISTIGDFEGSSLSSVSMMIFWIMIAQQPWGRVYQQQDPKYTMSKVRKDFNISFSLLCDQMFHFIIFPSTVTWTKTKNCEMHLILSSAEDDKNMYRGELCADMGCRTSHVFPPVVQTEDTNDTAYTVSRKARSVNKTQFIYNA